MKKAMLNPGRSGRWDIADIVVWVDPERKHILITPFVIAWPPASARIMFWGHPAGRGVPGRWVDLIGATFPDAMTNAGRVQQMLGTAIELTLHGYAIGVVLSAFSQVRQFHAWRGKNIPAARVITEIGDRLPVVGSGYPREQAIQLIGGLPALPSRYPPARSNLRQ
jgi:hypothetical protein